MTGPLMGCSHMYTMGSEELLASLLSSFSRAPLNCWYLQRSHYRSLNSSKSTRQNVSLHLQLSELSREPRMQAYNYQLLVANQRPEIYATGCDQVYAPVAGCGRQVGYHWV